MNIFYTDSNPKICAQDHCDIHVRKMIVEYSQLLSTAHRIIDGTEIISKSKTGRAQKQFILDDCRNDILYKATHINHPSAKWVRDSSQHYLFLVEVLKELFRIYELSGKTHKSYGIFSELSKVPKNLLDNGWKDPYIAINEEQYSDLIESYNSDKNTINVYRKYMITKFEEWSLRENKRKMFPTWENTPHWVKI